MDERQRITQDMHDGLGLMLNAALRQADKAQDSTAAVASAIRTCLDELRLIVDASATDTGAFLPQLATLRFRMQPRLEAIGLHVHWRMDNFPQDLVLPPEAALHVLRIVQEAINNTVKYAQANAIDLVCVSQPGADPVSLVVRDDGCGFAIEGAKLGNGLSGMKRRASAARVALELQSSPTGTAVRIDIPLPAR